MFPDTRREILGLDSGLKLDPLAKFQGFPGLDPLCTLLQRQGANQRRFGHRGDRWPGVCDQKDHQPPSPQQGGNGQQCREPGERSTAVPAGQEPHSPGDQDAIQPIDAPRPLFQFEDDPHPRPAGGPQHHSQDCSHHRPNRHGSASKFPGDWPAWPAGGRTSILRVVPIMINPTRPCHLRPVHE